MLLKARPLYWLWGLIPLLLLGVLIVYGTQGMIEKDLGNRAAAALKAEGIEWATPRFMGLTGTIEGEAPTEMERLKAVKVVRGVWGVRSVVDQLSLSPLVSPYKWSAVFRGGKVQLSGHVPSAKMQQSIAGLVKAKFSQASLSDKLRVARGVADENRFLGQISFGLSQLALMNEGEVQLIDDQLSLTGTARDKSAFEGLGETFAKALPLQLRAGAIQLMPPVVGEYRFMAERQADGVVIEGVVPSGKDRDAVLSLAGDLYKGAEGQPELTLGSGAPHGWADALQLSLKVLTGLETGKITIEGQDVRIEGTAKDTDSARNVRRNVRANYPTGFKVTDQILVKEPELPLQQPFITSIKDDGEAVTLTGFLATEAERGALLEAVRAAFPDRGIVDQLTLARGAGADLLTSLGIGLKLMKGLSGAELVREDNMLRLNGESADEGLVNGLKARPGDLAVGIDFESAVRYTPPPAPVEEEVSEAETEAETEAESEEKVAGADAEPVEDEASPADSDAGEAAAEGEKPGAEEEVKSSEELADKRQWLSPEETEKRLDDLYQESGAVTARECQLLMNSIVRGIAIRFGVNSSVINPESYEVLEKVTSVANKCSNTVIRIEGHTDSDGSDAYNLELSKRRARSVIGYLVNKGVPSTRLDAKGYGEHKPVASNGTGAGKALNRRIEFVVFEN